MSEPIKVGDLVQVVKPTSCCGRSTPMQGHIFTVTGFVVSPPNPCKLCDAPLPLWQAAEGGMNNICVDRLKRIPPLDELEGIKTEEDIREPA